MRRTIFAWLAVAMTLGGCNRTEDGLHGIATAKASHLAEQRFVRRAFLDLTGEPPSDQELAQATATLETAGGTAKGRRALADQLLARPAFATYFVAELEAKAFGGVPLDQEYAIVCGGAATTDATCASCDPNAQDPCACSACSAMKAYAAERDALRKTASDLASGATTPSSIGRRYAESRVFQDSLGDPDAIATSLFKTYVGKKISPEELHNASLLVTGSLSPGANAGQLFHRVGKSYADLVDIVFASEVYREALVEGVFQRYLGRSATPDELAAFVPTLDPKAPDVRPVIALVLASAEYFTQ